MMRTLPYSRQHITEADIKAVAAVLRSDFLTQGEAVPRFEAALAKKVGARYCVAFANGTAALHAAYFAAGIGAGDEVLVPGITFAATGNAALYLGARPVFVDVDLDTGLMSLADAEKKITKRTRAIVPVDYAGRPVDIAAFRALAKKHKLIFIEDGAQSLGAAYKKKSVGSQADMTMFSFHPVKSITTGEGGAITTNSEKFYEHLVMFRTHGITKHPKRLKNKKEGGWHQEMHVLGFNYRLTDIHAALGISQMKRLGANVAKRRALAKRYDTLLKNIPGITRPPLDTTSATSAWHLYPILLTDKSKRKEVYEKLRACGIGVQVHYIPVYLHPHYQKLGYKKGLCPNAENFYARELSIPLYPTMTKADQDRVVRELKNVLR